MSLATKLSKFARSSQGKKLVGKAMNVAKDPKTKAKIAEQRAKLAKKDQPGNGSGSGGTGPTGQPGPSSSSTPPPPPPPG